MDDFCGSEFWNITITWYSNDPDLTACFQKTVLVWTPCLFLWVFSPLEVYYIVKSKTRDIPWNWLNLSKLFLTGVIMILSLVDGFSAWRNCDNVFAVDYWTPVIKLVTFGWAALLMWYSRQRGIRVSGTLFLFWFFLILFGIVQFRSEIRKNIEGDNDMYASSHIYIHHVTYLIYFPIVILLLLLNCVVDAKPRFSPHAMPENQSPELQSPFLSRIFYTWFDTLILKGFKNPLETKDLWSLNPEDTARELYPRFEQYWKKSVEKTVRGANPKVLFRSSSASVDLSGKKSKKTRASVLPAICKTFAAPFIFSCFFKIIHDLLTFASPQILKLLISYVENKDETENWKGYFYAVLMFIAASLQTLFVSQYFQIMFLIGMRIRTALVSAVYRKALRLSPASRKESTVGEIVNLMAVDTQRFLHVTAEINTLWSAPLQISLALYFLWDVLGPSILAGLAAMILLIPVNGFVSNRMKVLHLRQMKYKDERVKLMNEVLNGIKVLKLYAWEPSFEQQVFKIRDKEIQLFKQAAYLHAIMAFVWSCTPFLVALVTFATYVLIDDNNELTPVKAFVSLSLINIMKMPLTMLPMTIISIIQASVSIKRINKFMNAEELDESNITHNNSEKDSITIENGTFSWGIDENPVLKNINLHIETGSLVAIVGSVGSGKSSLISALLGETDKLNGRVNVKGSVAFVPQQAWVQNATLKENIIFGNAVNEKFYKRIIEACALNPDLEMLPAGDQTEIGEKGINLSGGQKQRVSLARAVYYNADVYFFDDPLSAVDSHVGKHIFENVIGSSGLLRKKTRVLVTHSVTYLPEMDQIIVLSGGEVTEIGTYKQLLNKKGAFADFLLQYLQEGAGDDISEADIHEITTQLEITLSTEELRQKFRRTHSQVSDAVSDSYSVDGKHSPSHMKFLPRQTSVESNAEKKSLHRLNSVKEEMCKPPVTGDKLVEVEKSETGGVKCEVYTYYLKSIGFVLSMSILFLNILFQGFSIGSNIWLAKWTEDNNTDSSNRDMYLGVYGVLGLGQGVSIFFASGMTFIGCLEAANQIHKELLKNIMRTPLSFFDVTPVGRILNRFSRDIDALDSILPMFIRGSLSRLLATTATIVVVTYSTPVFASVMVPLGIAYFFLQRYYIPTSRQLKRLESVSRSPIYSHFGESITGAPTIRAYGVQDRFIVESNQKLDSNQISYYPTIIANRWLGVRVEMMGNLIIFFSALFAVMQEDIDEGTVGLSVSYALQITQSLNWLIRMISDIETNIVAVERIKEYREITQEAAWDISSTDPPNEWPEKGMVDFKKYEVRYRAGLDLVLRGITFSVKGGEKIGIVGRTGAGKSSLTLALFRIIEAAGGSIFIDGRDISKMGLHALRSHLTIIPQDPVLFSGTLRINLDPFKKYSDEDIWRALEHAHLKNFVNGLAAGLNHEVIEGGENLSVGQRQLICLARALLRKTKVLILDEATAAVDMETDDLIQETIRTEFKECTVLTIAHRLNTIMDSNRVIVLDKGSIIEYDTPEALLQRKNSVFYGMARDAGLV